MSPRSSARNIERAEWVGRESICSTGTPQISAARRRSCSFCTTPRGRVCVKVPASCTALPPLGCPVVQNGLFPGDATFPTSRWML